MFSLFAGAENLNLEAGKYRQMGDGSLIIEGVQYDDQSVYVCSAENGVHSPAVKNVVLRVHGNTEFPEN